jgi:hypothetical protein
MEEKYRDKLLSDGERVAMVAILPDPRSPEIPDTHPKNRQKPRTKRGSAECTRAPEEPPKRGKPTIPRRSMVHTHFTSFT